MLGIAIPPITPAHTGGPEGWVPTLVVLLVAAVAAGAAVLRARSAPGGGTVHHFPRRHSKAA